jgi:hypothetical protein
MIGKVMLFNPFTGTPRHPDDIKSDPKGLLVWDGEEPLRAAPQASQPPQGAEPDACPRCNGEGTVRSHTTHLGPDDYDFDEECPSCAGTGSADLKEAINALGFWTHKTDITRTLIERSAVLRILEARAALAAYTPPATQEPAAESVARWLADHDLIEEAEKVRALYAAPEGRGE